MFNRKTEGKEKMRKENFKKENIKTLNELYEKANDKIELLYKEWHNLWRLIRETERFKWKISYWLGKKKAEKCPVFRKVHQYHVKCLANRLEATPQELFRYWCSKCTLSDKEKMLFTLENKLGERR